MSNMERVTKKQRELLVFVQDFIAEHDYSPSYREIMRALGYKSVSTVATHIEGLVAKQLLRRADNSPRSLELVVADNDKPTDNNTVDEIMRAAKTLLGVATAEAEESLQAVITTLRLIGRDSEATHLATELANMKASDE